MNFFFNWQFLLCSAARPLEKLIPVDEFLPIMFNQHQNQTWKKAFPERNLVAWSTAPLLLFPTHYTGEDGYFSDTEQSDTINLLGNHLIQFIKYLWSRIDFKRSLLVIVRWKFRGKERQQRELQWQHDWPIGETQWRRRWEQRKCQHSKQCFNRHVIHHTQCERTCDHSASIIRPTHRAMNETATSDKRQICQITLVPHRHKVPF